MWYYIRDFLQQHGGAQAALPMNIDISRRLVHKNSALSDTTKSTSLDIIFGTKFEFLC